MGLVIDGMVAALLLVAVAFVWSLRSSLLHDRVIAKQQQASASVRKLKAERDASMYRAGTPLHCVGCGLAFTGPLTDDGCPECHVATLVITEQEYQETVAASPRFESRDEGATQTTQQNST